MTDGYRKAALSLYGLGKADQKWLLSRLPESERNQVKNMLHQLQAMGVPQDHDLLDDIRRQTNGKTRTLNTTHAGIQKSINVIDSAPVEAVIAILDQELDWVIAILLEVHDWTWTQAFLVTLDEDHRAAVCQAAKQASTFVSDKLRHALIAGLAETLSQSIPNENSGTSRFDVMLKNLETEVEVRHGN